MERKTKIDAAEGKHDLVITREFDLPVDLLFRAYVEPEIVEKWMSTRVIKLDNRRHGGFEFETSDPRGNVVFRANGTIHDLVTNERIIRTFEMENTGFPVQLEFLDFKSRDNEKSKLTMQIVYRTPEDRDNMLRLPFAAGISMAHDRLQEVAAKLR